MPHKETRARKRPRLPARLCPGSAPIYSLIPEIVDDIVELVEWPHDTAALAATCRAFYIRTMPALYRSIIISHRSPRATCAMLSCIERSPAIAAMVRTVIFDEAPSAFYTPLAPPPSALAALTRKRPPSSHNAMFPAPRKALDDMAWHVAGVLPLLRGVRHVFLRAVHPCVLAPCVVTYEAPRSKLARGLPPCMTGRVVPYHAFHLCPPHLTWHTLARLPVERLSALLLSKSAPHRGSLLLQRGLHTLHLSGACFADPYAPAAWNDALRCMQALHTLVITNLSQGVDVLLDGCYFDGLSDLELYKVRADEDGFLRSFIRRHASSLQVIALCLAGSAFPDSAEFPALHTLRVDNVADLKCFACVYAPRAAVHGGCKGATPRICGRMSTFVARHAGLRDLALSGMPDDDAVDQIVAICRNRYMRRVLLGDAVAETMARAVPAKPGTSAWRRRAERWVYFDFLFEDLELRKPEYRSQIFSQGKMYKRH